MSEHEQWFNSLNANGKTVHFLGNEHKVSKMAWDFQQAEIDRLSSVLDERTKEWLQAIKCGTYFENVAKPLKEENDRLKAQLNNMEACRIERKRQVEGALRILDDLYRKELFAKPTAVSDAIKILRGESDQHLTR